MLLALDEGDDMAMNANLKMIFDGLSQRKCQTFDGYAVCAHYNPSDKQYRINLNIGSGKKMKSKYQQNRQNIQRFAAKTLTDNVLSDEFVYDDDEQMDADDVNSDDAVYLTDC